MITFKNIVTSCVYIACIYCQTIHTASIPVLPGDIVILATDGLFDNVDLSEWFYVICTVLSCFTHYDTILVVL